jgi:molybdopterin synthase sulfur carrier subunit
MKVKVKFYSHLRDLIGAHAIDEVECEEGATISIFLDQLFLDSKIKNVLYDEEQKIKPGITILKNGREIQFLAGLETVLSHEDEISLFPVVVGGQ